MNTEDRIGWDWGPRLAAAAAARGDDNVVDIIVDISSSDTTAVEGGEGERLRIEIGLDEPEEEEERSMERRGSVRGVEGLERFLGSFIIIFFGFIRVF